MNLQIEVVSTDEHYQAIARLRYDIYVQEMGKQPRGLDHVEKTVKDELDRYATIFAAFDGDVAVATGSVLPANALPPNSSWRSFYELSEFPVSDDKKAIFSKLMVHPAYRGSMALPQLLLAAYDLFRSKQFEVSFMHCAPGLVPMYELLGCRRYKQGAIDPDVGFRIHMALLLGDVEYFQRVRSPLLTLAKKYPANEALATWFSEHFARYSQPASVRMMDETTYLTLLSQQINEERSQLFDGTSNEEFKQLVRQATVIDAPQGHPILQQGDIGSEMYLVLNGAVEISVFKADGTERVLKTIGNGQIFGEGGFLNRVPRNANVITISPTKFLVLSAEEFERIGRKYPSLAVKVLLNLCRMLSQRLYSSNQD